MIRTVAAIFAKKTAIVAITGATVIGGATFALADDQVADLLGTDSSTEPVAPTEPTDPADPSDPTDPAEPTDPADPADPSDPADPADPEPTEPADPTGDSAELEAEITDPEDDITDPEDELDGPKDNHGATVSAAAKGGAPCDDIENSEFKNKGQCVASVARGEATTEQEPEAPVVSEPETTVETPPADDAIETQSMTQPADKPGKGNGNAGGNGKGKGGKG